MKKSNGTNGHCYIPPVMKTTEISTRSHILTGSNVHDWKEGGDSEGGEMSPGEWPWEN